MCEDDRVCDSITFIAPEQPRHDPVTHILRFISYTIQWLYRTGESNHYYTADGALCVYTVVLDGDHALYTHHSNVQLTCIQANV